MVKLEINWCLGFPKWDKMEKYLLANENSQQPNEWKQENYEKLELKM